MLPRAANDRPISGAPGLRGTLVAAKIEASCEYAPMVSRFKPADLHDHITVPAVGALGIAAAGMRRAQGKSRAAKATETVGFRKGGGNCQPLRQCRPPVLRPSLIAKVTSHVDQTGARSCRSVCRGTPKFRAMVSLRKLQIFLRSIVVKLRFRPRFPCNLTRPGNGGAWRKSMRPGGATARGHPR